MRDMHVLIAKTMLCKYKNYFVIITKEIRESNEA